MNFKGNFYMNFKKILFFVIFVLPSALFTSDHPIEQAVQLPQTIYKKGDFLDYRGEQVVPELAAFEVLETGQPLYGFLYVQHIATKYIGLIHIRSGFFKTDYTYDRVKELVELREKGRLVYEP